MNIDTASVRKCLVNLRKSRGLSRCELAEKANTTPGTIRRYETEAEDWKLSILYDIAYSLGVSICDMLPLTISTPGLSSQEITLLEIYRTLNVKGRCEGLKRLKELVRLNEYSTNKG